MDFTLPWIRDPSINQGDSFDRFIDRSSTRNIFIFWERRKRRGTLSLLHDQQRRSMFKIARDSLWIICNISSSMDTKESFRWIQQGLSPFGIGMNSMEDGGNELLTRGRNIFANFRWCDSVSTINEIIRSQSDSTIFDFLPRVVSENLKERGQRGIVRPDILHLLLEIKRSLPSMKWLSTISFLERLVSTWMALTRLLISCASFYASGSCIWMLGKGYGKR